MKFFQFIDESETSFFHLFRFVNFAASQHSGTADEDRDELNLSVSLHSGNEERENEEEGEIRCPACDKPFHNIEV